MPNPSPSWLDRNKDRLSAVQTILTILGLLLGFLWFQGQHQAAQKLKIEQELSARPWLGNGDHEQLLIVKIWLTNVGSVTDYILPGRIYIDAVNPRAARLYCYNVLATNKTSDCSATGEDQPPEAGLLERLRRSTVLGWFWPPKSTTRWIDANERDEALATEIRLPAAVKTVRVSSVWSSDDAGFWKAEDYLDLADAAPSPNTPPPAATRPSH